MNKAQLVEAVERRIGDRKAASDAVETVIDNIVRAVAKGERVAISGFGTFERVNRAARTGRNPRTGDAVRIKKTTVPKFKPGTAFKAYVAAPRSMPSASAASGVAVTSRGVATAAKKAAPAKKTAATAKKTTAKAAPAKATATKQAATKTATKSAATKSTAKTTTAKTTTRPAAAKKSAATTTAKTAPAKRTTTKRTAKKA